jgi:opacity protein-like surface antigen
MKHLIVTSALALALFGSVATAQAQEEKKKKAPLTQEQQALMKEITAKYDKDGDKKLSAEERKAISPEDREKMKKAGISGGGKGGEKKKETK